MPNNPSTDKENDIVEQVEKSLPPSIGGWVGLLRRLNELTKLLSIRVQIIIALIGLGVAIYFIYQWRQISYPLGDRIQSSLKENLDNTVWQHKGLAAYLLSGIDLTSQSKTEIANIPLNKIQTAINELPIFNSKNEETSSVPDDTVVLLKLTGDLQGPRFKQALYGGDESYYMFLPTKSLSFPQGSYDLSKPEILNKILGNNPDIGQDIQLAHKLVQPLKDFNEGKINGDLVVQTYFITEAGLILIRSPFVNNQKQFYHRQFDEYHNFTDRPYYWEAIKNSLSKPSLPAEFDYQSEPYIDLGGHGIVKTYSKAFILPNGRYGVLCIDVKKESLKAELKKRLDTLKTDKNPYEIIKIERMGDIVPLNQDVPEDFRWFSNELNQKKGSESTLLGKIATESQPSDGVLRFTIPLSSTFTDNKRTVELMCVRIDFKEFWARQSRYLVIGCVGIMIFLLVSLNILQDYSILWKKINEMATKIDRVMTRAKTPYVRLNDKNEFEAVNDSFVKMLGYGNEYELKGADGSRTFESLLEQESIHIYKDVLRKSISNEPSEEYKITLLGKNGEKINATVQGERVVFPSIREKKYPSRFGIFIKWNKVTQKKQINRRQNKMFSSENEILYKRQK